MAQLKAKKEFRKLMKSYKLPNVLQQEEDYEKYYDSPTTEQGEKDKAKEDLEDFKDVKEAMFYKDDVEFMRFHKRTTKNVHEAL